MPEGSLTTTMKTIIINNVYSNSAVHITVSENHQYGHFGQDGYSKYSQRKQLESEGKLPEGEQVYGYDQAVEHIAELKQSIYEGKKHHEHKIFEIRIQTISNTIIKLPQQ